MELNDYLKPQVQEILDHLYTEESDGIEEVRDDGELYFQMYQKAEAMYHGSFSCADMGLRRQNRFDFLLRHLLLLFYFFHFFAPSSVKVNYKNTSGLKSSRHTPYPSFSISTAISAGILFLPFTQLFTVERFFPNLAARAA